MTPQDRAQIEALVKLAKGYPENLKDAGLLQDSDKYEVVEALGNSIPAIERLLGIVRGIQEVVAKPDYTNPEGMVGRIRALLAAIAPKPPAEWMAEARDLALEMMGTAARYRNIGDNMAANEVIKWAHRIESIADRHYSAPAEGWIKCSDRLPEIGEEVQVYCIESVYPEKPRVKALARFIPYEEATTYYWNSAYGGGNRHTQQAVIAWQPLAAAPKDGGSEKKI